MATSSPLNGETFLAVVTKSMLVDPERLKRAVDEFKVAGGDAGNATALADHLVAKSLITKWQSEKLLQGKHKGYFLSKYKLLSLLGKGGMSSVFLAEHTLMKRRCAIKVLPHKRVADTSYLARFHREAQAVASLDHPNIVRAYDVDHQEDRDAMIHFLVMEYVEGLSLQELIAKSGPCSLVDSVDYVRQAAVGLAHAHKAGLVHRDIKPGNLLRDNSGVVKILDLGLARFFDNQGQEESLTIQHDEKVLGTADYLAPEQAIDSHSVDARADIYSLGCTFYFLLTGHPPFSEGTLTQRLMAHQTKEPPPVEKDRPEIPATLSAIVRKMMAKKPDDRYTTAEETAEALRKWLSVAAPPEWKKAHRELFAGDATNRPAPVMAQVVTSATPSRSATPVGPLPTPKVEFAPPPPVPESASSNVFSFGTPSEAPLVSTTPATDLNLAAFFDGLGTEVKSPSSPPKPAPKTTPQSPKPSAPPVSPSPPVAPKPVGQSSVVQKQNAPATSVVTSSPAVVATDAADFSFLNALAAPPVAVVETTGSGAFDFLGISSPAGADPPREPAPPPVPVVAEVTPVVDAPPAADAAVEAPPVEVAPIFAPKIEIATEPIAPAGTEGLFQFGDFTAPAAPAEPVSIAPVVVAIAEPVVTPPPAKPAPPPKAKPVAKVIAPIVEPEFTFGSPAVTDATPVDVTPSPSFDFGASSPSPFSGAPVQPDVTATPTADAAPIVAETEVVATAVESSADPRKASKKKSLPNRGVLMGLAGGAALLLLVSLAYGFGLLDTGTKAAVAKGAGKKSTPKDVTPSVAVSRVGTPSKFSEWSRKAVATVGVTGDFKTIGDALQTAKLHFKPARRTQTFTIKVAAGTYAERIVLDGKGWPNNIVITGEGGAMILEPSGADPIIKVAGVEGVQISNVLLKTQGKPVAVELGGNLARVRLQKFTVQGFSDTGILIRGGAGLSFSDARCQIEEGQFEPGASGATGVTIRPADGAEAGISQNILLGRLKFLGPLAAGIAITGKENANLEFRESLFVEAKVGVHLLNKTQWRDFQFVNNTFYKCPNPVLIAEQPDTSAKNISFRRNLFIESGPEVLIEKGFDEPALLMHFMIGLNRQNYSTRAKPEMPKNEVAVFGDGGQQGNAALTFVSTDPKHARFLAPAENAPQRNVGEQTPDEKPYIGAVAP